MGPLLIWMLFPHTSLFSSNPSSEELYQSLRQARTERDSLVLLHELNETFDTYDSIFKYSWLAYNLAIKPENNAYLAESALDLLKAFSLSGQPDSILKYGVPLIPLFKSHPKTRLKTIALNYIGAYGYNITGQYQEGVLILEEALEILLESGQEIEILVSCMSNLAIVYESMGDFASSSLMIERVIPIAEASGSTTALSQIALELGYVHYHQKEFQKSILEFRKCLASGIKEDKTSQILAGYEGLALAYLELEQYDSALINAKKRAVLEQEIGIEPDVMHADLKMAKILALMGRSNEAMALLEPSLAFFQTNRNHPSEIEAMTWQGRVITDMGNSQEGLRLLYLATQEARKLNLYPELLIAYQQLDLALQKTSQWEKASQIKDSLILLISTEQIRQRSLIVKQGKVREQVNQLRNTLKVEQLKNRNQKIALIAVLTLSLAFLVIGLLYYRGYQLKKSYSEELDSLVQERTRNLEQSRDELRVANEDLRHFAFLASHNFRNSVRTVSSMSDLIERKLSPDLRQLSGYLSHIRQAGKEMDFTLKGLNTYFNLREAPLQLSPINLTLICEEAFADVSSKFPEKEATNIFTNLPVVSGAKPELSKLFSFLFDNAFRYHPPQRDLLLQITGSETNTHFCISVQDNGIGIPKSYLDKIFEVFQRLYTSETYEGVGLGLTICRRITKRHGGWIEVESQEGQGSTFHVFLKKREAAGANPT